MKCAGAKWALPLIPESWTTEEEKKKGSNNHHSSYKAQKGRGGDYLRAM